MIDDSAVIGRRGANQSHLAVFFYSATFAFRRIARRSVFSFFHRVFINFFMFWKNLHLRSLFFSFCAERVNPSSPGYS